MSTALVNLPDLTRGDNATQPFAVTGLGDITAAEIVLTARDSHGAVVFTRANVAGGGAANQITITSGPSGTFEVYFVPANTNGLTIKYGASQTLYYDVEVTTAAGNVYTIALGTLTVYGDVTR